nr:putative ribonuclease H-like domain-containing protein [Tanacetum cinerariifolium]
EVYACEPPSFEDPHFPNKVYMVEKALYGLHRAPIAWYETLSTYLLENRFRRGIIDKTLFIKKDKGDILLVHVYVDDIIFRSTKNSLCKEFKGLMYKKFQIRSMMELTFFLGLQVMQKDDGIFISQDKYVADILKKFDFSSVKTTSTPIETNKALLKDEEAVDDSPFDLEAFSDSDYAGASLDKKSTIGGRENAQRNEFESMFGQDEDANGNRIFTPVNAAGSTYVYLGGSIPVNAATLPNADLPTNPLMPDLEDTADTGIFSNAYDDEVEGLEADFNNSKLTTVVSPIPTTRIHKDHPKEKIIGGPLLALQTRRMNKTFQEHAMFSYIKKQRRTNHKDYQNYLISCFLSQIDSRREAANTNSTNRLNTVSSLINTVSSSFTTVDPGRENAQRNEFESMFGQDEDANGNRIFTPVNAAGSTYVYLGGSIPVNAATLPNADLPTNPLMPDLEDTADTGIFSNAYDDEVEGLEADFNNSKLTTVVSPIPTTRIHKDHPKEKIIGGPLLALQTRRMNKTFQEHAMFSYIKKQRKTNHKDYQNYLISCFLS